jgi:hypothetical protein
MFGADDAECTYPARVMRIHTHNERRRRKAPAIKIMNIEEEE